MNFIKGPWKIDKDVSSRFHIIKIRNKNNDQLAEINKFLHDKNEIASLIVTAPDMFELLCRLCHAPGYELKETILQARDLIAKIEGSN